MSRFLWLDSVSVEPDCVLFREDGGISRTAMKELRDIFGFFRISKEPRHGFSEVKEAARAAVLRFEELDEELVQKGLEEITGARSISWFSVQSTCVEDGVLSVVFSLGLPETHEVFLCVCMGKTDVLSVPASPAYVKSVRVWEAKIDLNSIAEGLSGSRGVFGLRVRARVIGGRGGEGASGFFVSHYLGVSNTPIEAQREFRERYLMLGDCACVPIIDSTGTLGLVFAASDGSVPEGLKLRKDSGLSARAKILDSLIESYASVSSLPPSVKEQDVVRQLKPGQQGDIVYEADRGDMLSLSLNPAACLINASKLRVVSALWQDANIVFEIRHSRLPSWLSEAPWSIQVVSGKKGKTQNLTWRFPCLVLSLGDETCWIASIDARDICAKVGSAKAVNVRFRLSCEGEGWRYKSAFLGPHRESGTFTDYVNGFCNGDSAVLVPNESKRKEFSARVVGCDAITLARVSVPKRRPFKNRVLFTAMKESPKALHAIADAMHAGSLETSVHTDSLGRVRCSCRAGEHSVDVYINDLPGGARASMLDTGRTFEEVSANEVHETQFNVLYSMLVEIDEICQSHGIEYFLAAGTLLGAVRHKGFIPWDHDIDIYMRDTEFEKLRQLFHDGGLPEGRRIDCMDDDPLYPERLGRYVSCDTTRFNPTKMRGLGGIGGAGAFIDIFTFVPIAGDSDEQRQNHLYDFIVCEELRNRFERKHSFRPQGFYAKLDAALNVWDKEGYDAALAYSVDKMSDYRDENSDYIALRSAGTLSPYGRMLNASYFESTERVLLRDHEFSIPSGARQLLEDVYGVDWRVYPAKRRVPRDRSIYNSVVVPYRVVVDEALKEVGADEFLEIRSAHKHNLLEELRRRGRIDQACDTMARYAFQERRRRDGSYYDVDYGRLMAAGNWDAIDERFADYYAFQSLQGYGRLRKYAALTSPEFNAAILNLICNKSDLTLASKLVKIRVLEGGELDELEEKTVRIVRQTCKLRSLVETGELDAARKLLEELHCSAPEITFASQVELMLDLGDASSDEEAASVLERAFALAAKVGDAYSLFIVGECLRRLGRLVEAMACYAIVQSRSLDGVVLNIVDERLKEGERE